MNTHATAEEKPEPPLLWRKTPITDLSDKDITVVQITLKNMFDSHTNIRSSPEYQKKFKGQPLPDINPYFMKLKTAVDAEIEKRKK